jgi:hypothetical protein
VKGIEEIVPAARTVMIRFQPEIVAAEALARRSGHAAHSSRAGRRLARGSGTARRTERAAAPGRVDRVLPPSARACVVGAASGDPGDLERDRAPVRQTGAAGGGADLGRDQAAARDLAAPDEQVMAHTRQADLSTMRGYRRRARITADNPAACSICSVSPS